MKLKFLPKLILGLSLIIAVTAFGLKVDLTATVSTDRSDYQPGDVVEISGTGWQPGEIVTLEITHSTITHGQTTLTAIADVDGNIFNNEYVIQDYHLNEEFQLVAIGQLSGLSAQTSFTDAISLTNYSISWDPCTNLIKVTAIFSGEGPISNVCARVGTNTIDCPSNPYRTLTLISNTNGQRVYEGTFTPLPNTEYRLCRFKALTSGSNCNTSPGNLYPSIGLLDERVTSGPAPVAPGITCPADKTVCATSAEGASVTFVANATGTPTPTVVYKIGDNVITSPHTFPIGTTTVKAIATNSCSEVECTFDVTVNTATILARKFYDSNLNGTRDENEPWINGWKMTLTPGNEMQNTSGQGTATFGGLFIGTEYTVAEENKNNWVPTTSTSLMRTLEQCSEDATLIFGNVCLGAGGGYSHGFWGNKNGEEAFKNCGGALAALVALNLRTKTGAHFNPGTYKQYKDWNQSANGSNMAYMLSAQLAAMRLNVLCKGVSTSAMVYAPGCGNTGYMNNYISIGDLIDAANTSLGNYGLVPLGHAQYQNQYCLSQALDKANTNKNFVQATPCSFDAPTSVEVNQAADMSELPAAANKSFAVRVMPNPSTHQFSLVLEGDAGSSISLKVMDITGRMVESRSNLQANSTLQIGSNFKAGIYFVELVQGSERKTLKLIKQ